MKTVKIRMRTLGIIGFLLLIIFFTTILGHFDADAGLKSKCITLTIVYASCILIWVSETHKIASLFFIFLVYMMFSNAGQLLLYGFGIDFEGYYLNVINLYSEDVVIRAIDFQNICVILMTAFGIVAYNTHALKAKMEIDENVKDIQTKDNSKNIDYIDALFIIFSFVFIAFNVITLTGRIDSSYHDSYYRGDRSSASIYVKFPFCILMYASLKKHWEQNDVFKKVILMLAGLVALTTILYGSRNELITILVGSMFIVFRVCSYKIDSLWKKIVIVSILLFIVLIFNAISTLRNLSLSSLNLLTISNAFFSGGLTVNLSRLIAEMGGSMRTLCSTIVQIDRGQAHEATFIYTLLKSFVPVGVLNAVGITEPVNWSLSGWITYINGNGSGWGYSIIAEAFYNFGEAGFLFFAFFGYVYEILELKIERWYLEGKQFLAGAWLYVGSYIVFLARADSCLITTPFRYAVYITIISLLLKNKKVRIHS